MSGVPAEIGFCIYVRGAEDSADPYKGAFSIDYRPGMETFRYEAIGRDDEGVYLLADTGEVTRIAVGEDMFEDAGDLSEVRLEIRGNEFELLMDYDIVRQIGEPAYGV